VSLKRERDRGEKESECDGNGDKFLEINCIEDRKCASPDFHCDNTTGARYEEKMLVLSKSYEQGVSYNWHSLLCSG